MESRINYTLVGLFVVIFSTALVIFAFWLGKHNRDNSHYNHYIVYLSESVAGLAPEAAVKFHGVDVGKVERIRINPSNSEEVELTLKIEKETPIKTDSYAILKFYGITGLAYIEIEGGNNNAPRLQTSKDHFGVIPASASLIKRLDESLSTVAFKLSHTLDKMDEVLNQKNIENFSKTLAYLHSVSRQMDGYQHEIKDLLLQAKTLESNASESLSAMKSAAGSVKKSSESFNTMLETKITKTLESLEQTSLQTRSLIQQLETAAKRGEYDLASITEPSAKEIETTLNQARKTLGELDGILSEIKSSPSDLILKRSAPNPGPGE